MPDSNWITCQSQKFTDDLTASLKCSPPRWAPQQLGSQRAAMLSEVTARRSKKRERRREPTEGSDGLVRPPRTNQMLIQVPDGLLIFPIKLEIWRRKYQCRTTAWSRQPSFGFGLFNLRIKWTPMGSRSDTAGHAPLSGHFPEKASPQRILPYCYSPLAPADIRTISSSANTRKSSILVPLLGTNLSRFNLKGHITVLCLTQRFPHKSAQLLICSRK